MLPNRVAPPTGKRRKALVTAPKLGSIKKELFLQLLRETGHARMEVIGASMLPSIRPGDVIHVENGSARPGDIVVFDRAGHLCAHRWLAEVEDQAIARGDANRRLDPPFPTSDILGRVTSVERDGRIIEDLRFRPLMSLIIRNSQFARRVFLRLYKTLRVNAGPRTLPDTSRFAKLQG